MGIPPPQDRLSERRHSTAYVLAWQAVRGRLGPAQYSAVSPARTRPSGRYTLVDWGDLSVMLFKLRFGQDPTQSREDLEREQREAEFNRINDEIAETAALIRGRESLKKKDPGYNEQAFLAAAADAFLAIRKATARGDLSGLRPLMSEWCYREWSTRRLARIAVDRLTVRRLAIVRMMFGSDADSITVRIDAHTVAGETPIDELWTFMRKPDQVTQPGRPFGWTVASVAPTVG